jgi:SAM-dependent methyltransferase
MHNPSPFDSTAAAYDAEFTQGRIGTLARARFWQQLAPFLPEDANLLELGGGTGEDACHFATRGAHITHTDASPAMVEAARAKVAARGLQDRIQCHQLDMARLSEPGYASNQLRNAPFDAAYANFGAVNCVPDLPALAKGLASLLRPGAHLFLTVMGPLAPWEWAWYLPRAQFRKAFRRLQSGGTEWRGMRIHYPSPKALATAFAPGFSLHTLSVVNAFVPPSYCEAAFATRPRLLARLDALDARFINTPTIAHLSDHYLAHFIRN